MTGLLTVEQYVARVGAPTPPTIRVFSCGMGVQSTAIALLIRDGYLPKPDLAIFSDTRWEPKAVYAHAMRVETEILSPAGVPLLRTSSGDIRRDALDPNHRFASIPYYTQLPPGPCKRCKATGEVIESETGDVVKCVRCRGTAWDDGKGIARRQCTGEYKIKPIKQAVRARLGYVHPRPVPKTVWAEQWIGFSTDEIYRVKDKLDVRYTRPRHPLIELGWSRKDCERYLRENGWGHTVKSACVGCPFHGNEQWRDLRDNDPEGWAEAVAFDKAIRKGGVRAIPLNGEAFLHASRMPLDQAPIDRVTAFEWAGRQRDLFDLLEVGRPTGCGPFGCPTSDAA